MARDRDSITITTLRGGLNDNDPALSLSEDQCTIAENVEFFNATLGERRKGCTKLTDLPLAITNREAVTWLGVYNPTNTLGDEELWALSQDLNNTNLTFNRRSKTAWSTVSPADAVATGTTGRKISAVSLHGKYFVAYDSLVDQLHVWDGTNFRKTGLTAPAAAPTAADTGVGTFTGTRYYRVREAVVSGSAVTLRSEPSSVLTKAPSTTGSGLIVTKPATANTNATHWELEASTDNANFYRIARTAIATTTVTDSVAYATGYANSGGVLSEDLTAYSLIPSGKYLTVDADRLIIAGSWENSTYGSRIWWTPVFGDTGTGNDERLDMTVNPYIDLDGFEGGEITGISRAVNGYLYAFKWSHIYKVVRTGQRTNAYSAVPITKSRGAIPGSLVEAVDQAGYPAQYFLDPKVGPMRIGQNGLEWCGKDIRNLWSRINLSATTIAHGIFYQAKNQVHFWLALDGADYPNAKIILHCGETTSDQYGARRGWVTVPVGNRISDAHCSLMFSDNADSVNARSQNLVPLIGKQYWTVSGSNVKDLIQRCDTGTTDAFTTGDSTAYYYGTVQTKPFVVNGLLNQAGVLAGSLATAAVSSPSNDVYVKTVTDFFTDEARPKNVSIAPKTTESVVIKNLDSLSSREFRVVQFAFGDLDTNVNPATSWQLHSFSAKVTGGQTS